VLLRSFVFSSSICSEKKKQREVKRTRGWIEEEKNKCKEVQLLKFGQIVDLAILEKVQVDEGAADLKDKLKKCVCVVRCEFS
jgi:hypothetical protein